MVDRIHAFWCRYPSYRNFGDALTPWLIRHITGQYPTFVWPRDPRQKYIVVGSLIAYAGKGCTVWGSGILTETDSISPDAHILAVRGPLTRKRALECGAHCPARFGDPALLLPMMYSPGKVKPHHALGIVPHYLDKPRFLAAWPRSDTFRFIDIQQPIETVIDGITSCSCIASSSLHGLIVAHAYGIPAVWISITDRPHGDGIKFRDYFAFLGRRLSNPVSLLATGVDQEALIDKAGEPPSHLDLDGLRSACPFRLRHGLRE